MCVIKNTINKSIQTIPLLVKVALNIKDFISKNKQLQLLSGKCINSFKWGLIIALRTSGGKFKNVQENCIHKILKYRLEFRSKLYTI